MIRSMDLIARCLSRYFSHSFQVRKCGNSSFHVNNMGLFIVLQSIPTHVMLISFHRSPPCPSRPFYSHSCLRTSTSSPSQNTSQSLSIGWSNSLLSQHLKSVSVARGRSKDDPFVHSINRHPVWTYAMRSTRPAHKRAEKTPPHSTFQKGSRIHFVDSSRHGCRIFRPPQCLSCRCLSCSLVEYDIDLS